MRAPRRAARRAAGGAVGGAANQALGAAKRKAAARERLDPIGTHFRTGRTLRAIASVARTLVAKAVIAQDIIAKAFAGSALAASVLVACAVTFAASAVAPPRAAAEAPRDSDSAVASPSEPRAAATPSVPSKPESAPASPPQPAAAAGVLGTALRRGCSGVLIAPDIVATAGHCSPPTGAVTPIDPSAKSFHTGAYPGRPSASRPVSEAMRHPLYRPGGSDGGRLATDVALLRLSAPLSAAEATPIPLGAPAEVGERLVIASWPGGEGARARERACPVIAVSGSVVTLACAVRSGESGAPVLRRSGDGLSVAAIVVARGQSATQPLAYAVQAGPRLRQIGAIYLSDFP